MAVFEKHGDDHVIDILLPGLQAPEVRQQFGLEADEYPGDGLFVEDDQAEWLRSLDVPIDRQQFAYFVEPTE